MKRSSSQLPMEGKICLITGANSGVGKETALGLARGGAHVIMGARDRLKGEVARDDIRAATGNQAVDLLIADLASQPHAQN
jgi:retinol dehydrogenase-12/retinol dehydrogenase-13